MIKALIYAYINNIYSSRRIEQAIQESIFFMFLTGMSKPDNNTIKPFRGEVAKERYSLFLPRWIILIEEGLLSLKDLYTDGTKIEANANRYSFVGKAIKTGKDRIERQLDELWKYAQSWRTKLNDTDPTSLKKIEKEQVTATIETINKALKDKKIDSKVRQNWTIPESTGRLPWTITNSRKRSWASNGKVIVTPTRMRPLCG